MDDILLNFMGVEYKFMPTEEFKKLTKLEEINYIIHLEIIERSLIAALSSILERENGSLGFLFHI